MFSDISRRGSAGCETSAWDETDISMSDSSIFMDIILARPAAARKYENDDGLRRGIGAQHYSLPQLMIIQEVITTVV
jgi:hypothetical protein